MVYLTVTMVRTFYSSFFLVTFFRVGWILPVAYVRVANLVRPGCSVHCYAPAFSQDLLLDYRWHIQATYWRTGTSNWYRTHYRFEIMPPNSDIGACHYIMRWKRGLRWIPWSIIDKKSNSFDISQVRGLGILPIVGAYLVLFSNRDL